MKTTLREIAALLFALPLAARAVVFTSDITIAPDNVTYAGADIVISNATLTVDGPHTFASLLVGPGGTITHSYSASGMINTNIAVLDEPQVLTGTNAVLLASSNTITSTVTVRDLSGTITYQTNTDYILFTNGSSTYLHRSAPSSIPDGALVLVSYAMPGGTIPAGLNLTVTGSLEVSADGSINATGRGFGGNKGPGNGGETGSTPTGAGAGHGGFGGNSSSNAVGGTCYGAFEQPAMLGSGGGLGNGGVGGAGGGLIQLTVGGTALLEGLISANGLNGTNSRSGGGSGGSIWLTAQTVSGTGAITAHGGNGEPIHGGGGGGGRIAIFSGTNRFSGTLAAYGGNGWKSGGAGTVFTKLMSAPTGLLLLDNGGRAGTNSLVAVTNGTDVLIRGYASVLPSGDWLAGHVTIQSGAALAADAMILGGSGVGAVSTTDTVNYPGGGAGHGGYGGMGSTNVAGGNGYGTPEAPLTTGSSGGTRAGTTNGGRGGGGVRLSTTGTLRVDGRLSANGGNGLGSSGGGSGGSVYLTAHSLAGGGVISANGGDGAAPLGGGGGGGRVALVLGSDLFAGTIEAYGGAGARRGGAGTILITTNQTGGRLILDNHEQPGTNTPLASITATQLIVRGGAIGQLSNALNLASLLVASNSWLTVRTQSPQLTLSLTISGDATIEPGGGISVDARSLSSGGQGSSLPGLPCGGGGHGGFGGNSAGNSAAGGNSSGSTTAPNSFGGGGGRFIGTGAGNASYGGLGGGVVRLIVNGTLNLGGKISADGSNGAGLGGGGGAGGSLWLTLGTLTGNGSITAHGGSGVDSVGGGGGGGRISITLENHAFTGGITAYGGGGANWGGAGTIYLKTNAEPTAFVLLDNGGNRGTNTTFNAGSVDLTVTSGAIGQMPSGITTIRNLLVRSNAVLASVLSSSLQTLVVTGEAVVEAGGAISADARGQSTLGSGSGDTGYSLGGGGHGGRGGANQLGGGGIYGSITTPSLPGSFGSGRAISYGGGALRITLLGTLTVNGRVSANGKDGEPGDAGGSGGSLWITTNGTPGALAVIAGNGVISAKGGVGNGYAGGGGGGRISIISSSNAFTGTISAVGGLGLVAGGAGTIYTKSVTAPVGQLLVDNGGLSGVETPVATTNGLPTVPFDFTINGGAMVYPIPPLPLLNNLTLTTGGSFTMRTNETNLVLNVLGDVNIGAACRIAVDGKGHPRTNGPGAGKVFSGQGGGGGYGGVGGAAASGAAGGTNYGSLTQPVHRGSGGGVGSGTIPGGGGEGGGAIRLIVGGTLTLDDGRLSANGSAGLQDDSGGGAGGSIWVTASAITGSGSITADGGAGELFNGGGGGGGRIAIYSLANAFTGSVSVAGGAGASPGGTGTVFQSSSLGEFTVVSNSPSGVVSNGVSRVDFVFSAPFNPLTLDGSDVSMELPPGALALNSLTLSNLNPTTLRASFPLQTTPGNYLLRLGPGIEDVFGQPMSQVHTNSFTIVLPTIQGTVTNANGQPVPGVAVAISGLQSGGVTDANGAYVVGYAPPGYLTLAPALPGYSLVPSARTYAMLTNSLANQDFLLVETVAPTLNARVSGTNVMLNWPGLPGVIYQPLYSTDLVNWQLLGVSFPGTNGLIELLIPTEDEPQKFFRVQATY